MATVLIVDDAEDLRFSLGNIVQREGDTMLTATHVQAPVLITGENGTGKELAARAIHEYMIHIKITEGSLSKSIAAHSLQT